MVLVCKSLVDGWLDVVVVYLYWCFVNYDCDLNVIWDWGGRMVLKVREMWVVDGCVGGIK